MTDVPHFDQSIRPLILANPAVKIARKRARIIAVQCDYEFTVETARGVVRGGPGDWLVTNHPDDDPGSDVWVISDERYRETYEETAA